MEEPPNTETKCSDESPDETSNSSYSNDELEIEQDVKVCDICGDTGREDLLAICAKCSDGAEHTYCMREMLEKVPESDWICEECKVSDRKVRQIYAGQIEGVENSKSSGFSGSTVVDAHDSDLEVNKANRDNFCSQVTSRRDHNNSEAVPSAKNQMVETVTGSTATSLAKVEESSIRGSYKESKESAHQASIIRPIDDVQDVTSSAMSQSAKRILSKSNSFDISLQPKVVPCGEAVPQSNKITGETVIGTKNGPPRVIGKSMSFRSMYPNRRNNSEGKVKFLSSTSSHGQDVRGFRSVKDQNKLDRSSSFRVDLPTTSSSISRVKDGIKLSSTNESSMRNNQGVKPPLSGKLCNVEDKKCSEHPTAASRLPSACGKCMGDERNANHINICDQPVSGSSLTADRPCISNDGNLQNRLTKSSNSMSQNEKNRDNVGVSTKEVNVMRGKSPHLKNIDLCGPRDLLSDAKEPQQLVEKGSNLRAAIEAAMLKKPVICRKSKTPDPPDNRLPSSEVPNCEVPSRDITDTSMRLQPGENVLNCAAELSKQSNTLRTGKEEISCGVRNRSLNCLNDEKFAPQELLPDASLNTGIWDMFVIPEHKYIWQGGFEVHRNSKLPDLCAGIQAHLSTRSSPRVAEVVKKFSNNVSLSEVPRLSEWPMQFHNTGVKDDNIALYFFAKDIESYDKDYKFLLDTMMKDDLALKGKFDEVELLIFPSNQLPEKSQCWNMLFFLWGVLKGKRPKCRSQISDPPNVDHTSIPNCSQVACNFATSKVEGACMSANTDKTLPPFEKLPANGVSVVGEDAPGKAASEFSPDGGDKICMHQHEEVDLNGSSNKHVYELDKHSFSGQSSDEAIICTKMESAACAFEKSREKQFEMKDKHVSEPNSVATSVDEESQCNPNHAYQSKEPTSSSSSSSVERAGGRPCENHDNNTSQNKNLICCDVAEATQRKHPNEWHEESGNANKRFKTDTGGGVNDIDTCERRFFPLDPTTAEEKRMSPYDADSSPDLELALGAVERRPTKQERLPFFGNNRESALMSTKEDDGSSSLSLSLSFPSEERAKPTNCHGNTSFILFRAFPDR